MYCIQNLFHLSINCLLVLAMHVLSVMYCLQVLEILSLSCSSHILSIYYERYFIMKYFPGFAIFRKCVFSRAHLACSPRAISMQSLQQA